MTTPDGVPSSAGPREGEAPPRGSLGEGPSGGREGQREPSGSTHEWRAALGLFAVAFGLSIAQPAVLIGIPLVVLLLVFRTRRVAGLVAGVVAAFLAFGGATREGLWYVERGWGILLGGWFAALTLRFPGLGLTHRAVASVAGALAVGAAVFTVRPGAWEVLDGMVAERLRSGMAAGLEALRLLSGEGGLSSALVGTVQRAAEFQMHVFPALLGLASLASLGVAWWLYLRLANGLGRGLSPVREFRFNDHFVWVFIAGLVLVATGWGEAWGRAGSNAVVFMGALYALRGAAVLFFAVGGVSFFGAAALLAALIFVAPVVLAMALVIGLGDTWLDLRRRLRARRA